MANRRCVVVPASLVTNQWLFKRVELKIVQLTMKQELATDERLELLRKGGEGLGLINTYFIWSSPLSSCDITRHMD